MIRHHFQLRETIATVLADDPDAVRAGCAGMIRARQAVEHQVAIDPFFRTTLEPYMPDSEDKTIRRMTGAARSAGVGPMAAVAGAIAWAGAEAMQEFGASFGVIDNGGDIALFSDRTVSVGLHAGDAPVSDRCAFIIPPQRRILGCCTSSATVGPSLSFGIADAVTVFSRDVAYADAWATAICNEVRPGDLEILEKPGLKVICGVFIVIGSFTVAFGKLPPLCAKTVDPGLITAGKPSLS
jgi:ApbE superfamily uncharacterized protein (UPF0280 family)